MCQYHSSDFYPRPPCGGRQQRIRQLEEGNRISIHALRAEGDVAIVLPPQVMFRFLSTPSVRRATAVALPANEDTAIISIHALRAEGDRRWQSLRRRKGLISIHALRAEGDRWHPR